MSNVNGPLHDLSVVLTGASSGIGRATALAFARGGANLVLVARQEQALRELGELCDRVGGRALPHACDVADEDALRAAAELAVRRHGGLDVWVNNAAVTVFGRVEDVPPAAVRRIVDTNILGYVNGARVALAIFRREGAGVLINVASQAGKVGQPFVSLYNMTKFAVVGLAESLRMENRDLRNVHVCTVLPASIDTPLFQHAANYSGRAIKPVDPVYDAEQVADTIVRLALRPRREVAVGNAGRVLTGLRTLAPAYAERRVARHTDRNHFFPDREAPASDGNLFESNPKWNTVEGGWRAPRVPRRRGRLAALAIAGAGLALTLLALRRPGLLPAVAGTAGARRASRPWLTASGAAGRVQFGRATRAGSWLRRAA